MTPKQDPTAADIAYAQYLAAAEKTGTVGGCVYHRIICKTHLPSPVDGVELIVPRAMFHGAWAGRVEDEHGRMFRLSDPVMLRVPGTEPPWSAQSLVFVVHGCTADDIGAFLRAL